MFFSDASANEDAKGMLYSIKMRAESGSRHVSGAERIVERHEISQAMDALTRRGMDHPNGPAETVTVTVRPVTRPLVTIQALPVSEPRVRSLEEARQVLDAELCAMGLQSGPVLSLLYGLREPMRGAVLLDADSLRRLEPDQRRGVRATCMDYTGNSGEGKNHFKEALCLSSKVAHCPQIIGELCISDDPDFTTGYFASRDRGYVRIHHVKKCGMQLGGRIFLFRGSPDSVQQCMDYLENQPVMVCLE